MAKFKSVRDDGVEIDWQKLRESPFVYCDLCHAVAFCPDKYSSPEGWAKDLTRPRRDYCPKCSEKRKEAATRAAS